MILNRIWLYIFATMCTTAVIAMDQTCAGRTGWVCKRVMYPRCTPDQVLDCRTCEQLRDARHILTNSALTRSLLPNDHINIELANIDERMRSLDC
jgi:hypothetical protein